MTAPTEQVPTIPTVPSPDGAQAVAPDPTTAPVAGPDATGAPVPEQPPSAAPGPVTPTVAPESEKPPVDGDEGDLPTILPDPATLTVAGIPAVVRRINLRELMLLAQIASAGLGPQLARIDFSNMTDEKLIGLAIIALPEAGPEVTNFVRSVVVARDTAQQTALTAALDNPSIEDTLNVAGVLIVQEKDEFGRLGKHLMQMVRGLQALWRTGKRGT